MHGKNTMACICRLAQSVGPISTMVLSLLRLLLLYHLVADLSATDQWLEFEEIGCSCGPADALCRGRNTHFWISAAAVDAKDRRHICAPLGGLLIVWRRRSSLARFNADTQSIYCNCSDELICIFRGRRLTCDLDLSDGSGRKCRRYSHRRDEWTRPIGSHGSAHRHRPDPYSFRQQLDTYLLCVRRLLCFGSFVLDDSRSSDPDSTHCQLDKIRWEMRRVLHISILRCGFSPHPKAKQSNDAAKAGTIQIVGAGPSSSASRPRPEALES